jgi:hypothetical protein
MRHVLMFQCNTLLLITLEKTLFFSYFKYVWLNTDEKLKKYLAFKSRNKIKISILEKQENIQLHILPTSQLNLITNS